MFRYLVDDLRFFDLFTISSIGVGSKSKGFVSVPLASIAAAFVFLVAPSLSSFRKESIKLCIHAVGEEVLDVSFIVVELSSSLVHDNVSALENIGNLFDIVLPNSRGGIVDAFNDGFWCIFSSTKLLLVGI